tara:strand:- start:171 stop:617 length:447 start_codon:yes stop_codon:yes gene_type:complete
MQTTISENNKNIPAKVRFDLKDSNYATGRRKKSIARVWIKKGSGKIYVNGKEMNQYFKRPVHQLIVVMPLQETNVINQFDVKCHVKGGGLSGQAGAIIHGISRALVKADSNLKKTLKKNKFTTRDSRKVERKKYGHRKARRSFQFSKR